jgi:GAF domain-containing protein
MMPRNDLLMRTLVQLADSLVDDFDVVDLLALLTDRCVEVVGISAAGLMLVAPEGDLRVMAHSSETVRLLELFELQAQEGPCLDCYRSGTPLLNQDLDDDRWPRFAPAAREAGFRWAHAFPMRLRGTVIGALNLFGADQGPLDEADVLAAQALGDIATIAILQHRAILEAQVVSEQLQHALNTRVVIEQAKGMLAERLGDTMDEAFARLRRYSRDRNRLLADVAREVIAGELPTSALVHAGPARGGRRAPGRRG